MSLLMTDSPAVDGEVSDTDALTDFVVNAQLMLDPITPEAVRQQALGVFELFAIRDPALAALVRDELEARQA